MMKNIYAIFGTLLLAGCGNVQATETPTPSPDGAWALHKYYRDSDSPAAQLMQSNYAGVVATYDTREDCERRRFQAIEADKVIGYANSLFICDRK